LVHVQQALRAGGEKLSKILNERKPGRRRIQQWAWRQAAIGENPGNLENGLLALLPLLA
jgi:hypothetical protein